jgi:GT2 family glycosyltransferase
VKGAADDLARLFDSDSRLGAVAFHIVRADGETVSSEHPFRGPAQDVEVGRPCAYFVGAGYAVRREALVQAGGFDDWFFYSTEEVDLALTLTRLGWDLRYDPVITVEHRPSSRGRSVAPTVPALRLRNRIVLARRHFPAVVAAVHITAWAMRTGREAAKSRKLRPWLEAWPEGARHAVERRPLTWSQLRTVQSRGGRVWW